MCKYSGDRYGVAQIACLLWFSFLNSWLYLRAVRAMNVSLKQNRLLRGQGESGSYSSGQPEDVRFL